MGECYSQSRQPADKSLIWTGIHHYGGSIQIEWMLSENNLGGVRKNTCGELRGYQPSGVRNNGLVTSVPPDVASWCIVDAFEGWTSMFLFSSQTLICSFDRILFITIRWTEQIAWWTLKIYVILMTLLRGSFIIFICTLTQSRQLKDVCTT